MYVYTRPSLQYFDCRGRLYIRAYFVENHCYRPHDVLLHPVWRVFIYIIHHVRMHVWCACVYNYGHHRRRIHNVSLYL